MIPEYLTSDRATLEQHARQHCQTAFLGDNGILCRVLGKYLLFTDPSDITITPHFCLNGFWESWITLAIARILKPGMICVDVGANHGYYTLIMADAVETSGRVIAIEPNPKLIELLAMSLEVNGFDKRVELVPKAAANQNDAKVWLTVPPQHLADASVSNRRSYQLHSTEVMTVTIDKVTVSFPRIDLVKIDVEGAEEAVWDGMQRTLNANPEIVILMEFAAGRNLHALDFVRKIEACEFPLRVIGPDGNFSPVSAEALVNNTSDSKWSMLYLRRD